MSGLSRPFVTGQVIAARVSSCRRDPVAEVKRPSGPRPVSGGWRTQLGVIAFGSLAGAIVLYATVFPWRFLAPRNNFYKEAWPAYRALVHGHVLEFLRIGPAYIGSLVLRAPFALLASAFGGGPRAVLYATALPCLVAAPILGVWLVGQLPSGTTRRISPFVFCILNPIVFMGVVLGHPEYVLGSVFCVAAVVLAARGSAGWAGLLAGLAVVNESWALVVIPVVLAVLPADRRRALLTLGLTAGLIMVPIVIARDNGANAGAAATTLGSGVGNIFLTPQLLWWFGIHSWIAREAHVAIVVTAAVVSAAWWFSARRPDHRTTDPLSDALKLLTLVLLLRAALDPWDNLYYHVPFLFALMAYETGRLPRLTFAYTCLLVVAVPTHLIHGLSPDVHAAIYAAVALPTIAWLASAIYLPAGARARFRALAT